MINHRFRGRKILCICLKCGHRQPGWERVDGIACEICGGYLDYLGWWDDFSPDERIDNIREIEGDELIDFIKNHQRDSK